MMPAYFLSLVWLGLAAAFVLLAALNVSAASLRYAAGAAAAFVASIFGPLAAVQLPVFAAVTILGGILLRPREGMERFVGCTGRVTVAVCQGMPGRVQVGGCVLRAECTLELPAGTCVRVQQVNGDAVVVAPKAQNRRIAKAAA